MESGVFGGHLRGVHTGSPMSWFTCLCAALLNKFGSFRIERMPSQIGMDQYRCGIDETWIMLTWRVCSYPILNRCYPRSSGIRRLCVPGKRRSVKQKGLAVEG